MSENQGLLQSLRGSKHGRCVLGLLTACLLAGSMTGCYGRFPITKAIYEWNGRATDNHIINSIIMVVLAIIPVYGIAMLVDAIVINSIEYWDGDEVEISKSYTQPDGTTVVLAPGAAKNEAVLTIWKSDAILAQRTFVRNEAGVTAVLNESGEVVSHVTPDGQGGFTFTSPTGEPTGALSAAEVTSLRAGNGGADGMLRGAAL